MNWHGLFGVLGAGLTAGGTSTPGVPGAIMTIIGAACLTLVQPAKIIPAKPPAP